MEEHILKNHAQSQKNDLLIIANSFSMRPDAAWIELAKIDAQIKVSADGSLVNSDVHRLIYILHKPFLGKFIMGVQNCYWEILV